MEINWRLKQLRAKLLEKERKNSNTVIGSKDKLDRCRAHLHNRYGCLSERLRDAYIQMIMQHKLDYSVVLTFAQNDTSEAHAIGTLTECLKNTNRKIYNRSNDKLTVFPFLERNSNDGIHFHLLINDPCRKNDLETVLRKKWGDLTGTGYAAFRSDWFKPIDDLKGAAGYVTKQTYADNDPLVAECLHY